MSVILSGSMQAFPAETIFRFLADSGSTGTFRISARPVEIVFRSGGIVFTRRGPTASSSGDGSTRSELEGAIIDVFQAGACTFEFDDVAAAPEGAVAIALDLAALKAAAEANTQRRDEAHQLFSDPEATISVVSNPETSKISLEAEDFKLLMRIGAARLVRDVVRDSGSAQAVYDQLHRLREQGLIEIRVPEKEPEAQVEQGEAPASIGCLTLEDEARTSYPLFDDVCTIGRDATNTICIRASSVSGSHARVVRAPGGYAIEDAGSRNGTFVNGKQITRELLRNDDSIRLGKVYLIFNIADDNLNRTIEKAFSDPQ